MDLAPGQVPASRLDGETANPLDPAAHRAVLAALVPCLIGTLVLGLFSDGVHHDDDLVHFLMARWAHWYPEYLLHIWGRPGATIPLAAVAWIGDRDVAWHLCRGLSAVVTAAGAYLAARVAMRLGTRRAWTVVLACYLQPLNALLATTTLTENFTAFYLIAAITLLQSGRARWAALVFSLALLTRHEALILVPVWWAGLALVDLRASRKLQAALLTLWAPIAYNIAYRGFLGDWPARVFFAPRGLTEYSATHPLGYLPHALEAVPPVLFGLALVGGGMLIRRRQGLIPALVGVFFLTHCAITALGIFASGGYGRFMVAVAPLTAILIVAGWERLIDFGRSRRAALGQAFVLASVWIVGLLSYESERRAGRISTHASPEWITLLTAVAILAVIVTLFPYAVRSRWCAWPRIIALGILVFTILQQFGVIVRPLRIKPAQAQVARATQWLRTEGLDTAPLFAANPWFSYELNLIEDPRAHKGPALFASLPAGTIILVDSLYSPSYFHRLPLEAIAEDTKHYHWLKTFKAAPLDPQRQEIHIFRKIAPTTPATQPDEPYPPTYMRPRPTASNSYYIRPE
ncbi:MAG TPA: hypothetical protein VJZ71_20255 [Phycisphaerae bacterium]|nr:hypothetical protein [Phycisphaerae bacterium]